MRQFRTPVVAVVVIALILAWFSAFTVHEAERAIKFRLGEIVKSDYQPGLHFKVPFINNVRTFDARVQVLDEQPASYITAEQKPVIVDAYVLWRIGEDVERFYTSVVGSPERAGQRLSEIVRGALRSQFGKRTVQEVVSGERAMIMEALQEQLNEAAEAIGVSVVDVRIERIELPEAINERIYARMRSTRERVAKELRAQGAEAAERIRAEADRQRQVILAEAYREAEQLRGKGDAQSARIFAEAYERDPEFYSFYRSLNAYTEAFNSEDDVLVLSPEQSQFFRYFNSETGGGR
ncbi:protease modulator HflC [Alkalilimnicola sp. S0819]|uniref:protease modulator HflC n=1 Tax=Alkalilimnicola sp. S0819 TaxID=2613922 RepID=UPI00126279F9|nr:protease modulator HflC [Alkalilimnicola sp. S0819]KAB7628356.1 protease modulator HflC [Alkalilimnicola sp. S0819]MPQ15257.1 protease modulator HflC [Alkalilimnicola sp. S0819]